MFIFVFAFSTKIEFHDINWVEFIHEPFIFACNSSIIPLLKQWMVHKCSEYGKKSIILEYIIFQSITLSPVVMVLLFQLKSKFHGINWVEFIRKSFIFPCHSSIIPLVNNEWFIIIKYIIFKVLSWHYNHYDSFSQTLDCKKFIGHEACIWLIMNIENLERKLGDTKKNSFIKWNADVCLVIFPK